MSNDDDKLSSNDLAEAQRLAEQANQFWADLGDRRVRVVRAVVYEGPAARIREQLGRSLSIGTRVDSIGRTITISQGPIEIIDDGRQEPLPFTKDQP